ncbi:chemotaxis protein CheC [Lacrimispora xylanisolvens]|uniref:Chemotaxis protein CheC n=1 Tax=Lacrimispora xylanisolvens TaxID=384636 RepID=A0A2S6HNF0_9FIRM|nr:chemotaxis protein CheC [Hungatella xylanolytica]MBE5989371.1 chemotaxis protein CheC [Paenibacillaceae bacterium]PPK79041.1 chemotaxis protein CheC [Hungatella xylanolytica]
MGSSDMTQDILKELFNISVGRAAGILSDIVGQKIHLNVPNVKILKASSESYAIDEYISMKKNGTLMVSTLSFKENYTGKASLIFSAEKMKKFISLCLQEEQSDSDDMDFNDVDFDIIKEIGNIILNCIIGETGNLLNISFKYTLPEVRLFNAMEFKYDYRNTDNVYVLILYITFVIGDTEIEGAIIVDLSLHSINDLLTRIHKLEESLYE